MKHIKKITRKNCFDFHKDMLERGIMICPECEERLSDRAPIEVTIMKKMEIVYLDVNKESLVGAKAS